MDLSNIPSETASPPPEDTTQTRSDQKSQSLSSIANPVSHNPELKSTAPQMATDPERSKTQAPNFATRLLALPVEIRDSIWCFYFGHLPVQSIRYCPTYSIANKPSRRVCKFPQQPILGEKAILILLVSKNIYSEVSHWLYKKVKRVQFFSDEHLIAFISRSMRMGPLEYEPRIEFDRLYYTELSAHIIAEEGLVQMQKLSRAYSNCDIGEESESEPEPQWTVTVEMKARQTRTLRTELKYWKVVLLLRDRLVQIQPQVPALSISVSGSIIP